MRHFCFYFPQNIFLCCSRKNPLCSCFLHTVSSIHHHACSVNPLSFEENLLSNAPYYTQLSLALFWLILHHYIHPKIRKLLLLLQESSMSSTSKVGEEQPLLPTTTAPTTSSSNDTSGDDEKHPSILHDAYDTVVLGIPIFFSMLSWVGMKTTDSALLGHVSSDALAAAALSDLVRMYVCISCVVCVLFLNIPTHTIMDTDAILFTHCTHTILLHVAHHIA